MFNLVKDPSTMHIAIVSGVAHVYGDTSNSRKYHSWMFEYCFILINVNEKNDHVILALSAAFIKDL